MKQIITSLLDTDKYKITMMQERFFHENGSRDVKWKFTNRTEGFADVYHATIIEQLKKQLIYIAGLSFKEDELEYLQSELFHDGVIIKDEFIEYLRDFHLNSDLVIIDDDLDIYVEGSHIETTLWETFILSMYNEIYVDIMSNVKHIDVMDSNVKNINKKMEYLKECDFSMVEFGTRRRASKEIQLFNIQTLRDYKGFKGTSNMYFSKMLNIKCYGSVAHEFFISESAFAYIDGGEEALKDSQMNSLIRWNEFYEGKLNMFLSDTFGTDAFLEDYKRAGLLNTKNGVRHDSGDPIDFAWKMRKFYEDNDIETEPIIMFSDGLKVEFADRLDLLPTTNSFGIGTSLTFDIDGIKPLSIVCKVAYCWDEKNYEWVSTVKLSDNSNKSVGDPEMVQIYKRVFNYENKISNNLDLEY